MTRPSIALLFVLVLAGIVHIAQAQMPNRAYAPPGGPTLPYQLDYFRPQSGVLDQYNQFVAPKEQLATQMNSIVRQQNSDFQSVQRQFNETDRIRESRAAATGTAAGFMNYSHYFGGRTATAGRPANRQRQPLPNSGANFGNFGAMGYGT
jgi:hypothetical protein